MDLALTLFIVLAAAIWVLARAVRNTLRALSPSGGCGGASGLPSNTSPGFVPVSALLRRHRQRSRDT